MVQSDTYTSANTTDVVYVDSTGSNGDDWVDYEGYDNALNEASWLIGFDDYSESEEEKVEKWLLKMKGMDRQYKKLNNRRITSKAYHCQIVKLTG